MIVIERPCPHIYLHKHTVILSILLIIIFLCPLRKVQILLVLWSDSQV